MNPIRLFLVATALAGAAQAQTRLNELYVSHVGTDTREFIEIKGAPGASLAGHVVCIVEGDGTLQGTLDRAYDLSAFSLDANGYFVLGCPAVLPVPGLVLNVSDNFENGCETFYLIQTTNVAAITALLGTDVSNGPGSGTTVLPSLGTVLDLVGMVDTGYPATDAIFDGAQVLGPDGTFFPAGIYRCADGSNPWSTLFLDFDPALPQTPPQSVSPWAANLTCGLASPGTAFCPGDGSGTACPCANHSPAGAGEGCLNSLGTGGKLIAVGTPSLAADTAVLQGTQMPSSSALYYQGATRQNGGLGSVFGDGLRCAGGAIVRLKTLLNSAGASQYPQPGDPSISVRGLIAAPGTRTYQIWYRNAAAFCTASTFNLTNGWEIVWTP